MDSLLSRLFILLIHERRVLSTGYFPLQKSSLYSTFFLYVEPCQRSSSSDCKFCFLVLLKKIPDKQQIVQLFPIAY